jgi:hypothetical protein
LKRLMEINPTYCLTIEIVPFRNSDLLVAYGSLIREVRQAASKREPYSMIFLARLLLQQSTFRLLPCQIWRSLTTINPYIESLLRA